MIITPPSRAEGRGKKRSLAYRIDRDKQKQTGLD
ncbi:hypothetical protein ANO14919_052580 [Xylariales sp. No.14919]|nr:hypothetical protein ANO14919_052580 [Xylariales sp. No.14919]